MPGQILLLLPVIATLTGSIGRTDMVNVPAEPLHPLADGVTVIVAVTGPALELTAVKAGIAPEPEAPSPIPVLLFVQLKAVPATAPVKFICAFRTPLQIVILVTGLTVGDGLTVTIISNGRPLHPPDVGVTV